MKGRVLCIAGSDSGGGAGLQADLKTVAALGGYAQTAVTAITAQDTSGVTEVVLLEPAFVGLQIRLCLADIGADAIKIGMLGSEAIVNEVASRLEEVPALPLVLDPVMTAKGGASLASDAAGAALVGRLLARADLVTPNAPEAEHLTGLPVRRPEHLETAARRLLELGARAVLLKGGHLEGHRLVDLLLSREGLRRTFETDRIETRSTHGTGCTLASAIATGLAQGMALEDAVARAHQFVQGAIARAPGLGHGHGPLDHFWQRPEAFAQSK